MGVVLTKHLGPGPHPDGSPQSVHAGGAQPSLFDAPQPERPESPLATTEQMTLDDIETSRPGDGTPNERGVRVFFEETDRANAPVVAPEGQWTQTETRRRLTKVADLLRRNGAAVRGGSFEVHRRHIPVTVLGGPPTPDEAHAPGDDLSDWDPWSNAHKQAHVRAKGAVIHVQANEPTGYGDYALYDTRTVWMGDDDHEPMLVDGRRGSVVIKHLVGQHDQRTHATERPANPLVDLARRTSRPNVEAAMERMGRPLNPDVTIREHGLLTEREFLTESLLVMEATREKALESVRAWASRAEMSDPLFHGRDGHMVYRRGMQQRLDRLAYVEERIEATRRALESHDPLDDPIEMARLTAQVSKHRPGGQEHDQSDHGKPGGGVAVMERPRPSPTRAPEATTRPQPVGQSADPLDVISKFRAVMENNPRKAFVTWYTDEEARQMEGVTSPSGNAGLLVKDHGDGRREGTALFAGPEAAKGEGLRLLDYAVKNHGVNYAECFGPVLPRLYESIGFEVTESYPFNEEYAPKDWNYEAHNHPDYHIMRVKGVSKMAEQQSHIDALVQSAIIDAQEQGMSPEMAQEFAAQAYDVVGGRPPAPIAKHGSHNQQSHGRSQHGGARTLDDIEEGYTKQELLAFEADRRNMTFEELRDRYGAGMEEIWRATDAYVRQRRAFRGGFTKMAEEIAKHGNHDQKSHGRKGAGRDSLPTQSPHHDYSGQKYHGASEPGSAEAKEAMDYAEEVYDIYAERYFEGAEARMVAAEMGREHNGAALRAKMKNLGELRDKAMDVYDGNRPMSDLKSVMRRVRLLDPRQPVLKHRPGGKDHDQREHGKKKPGSGDAGTMQRPAAPIQPAATTSSVPENPAGQGDAATQPPPPPRPISPTALKTLMRSSLMDSSQKKDAVKMWAMHRQEQLLSALEENPEFGPEYVAHVRQAMETAGGYYGKGASLVAKRGGPLMDGPYATEHLYDHVDGMEGSYTPERAAMHGAMVDEVFEEAEARGVKREAKALFMGGLPGAGKSSSLAQPGVQEMLGVNLDEYITINPDDIKERLIEAGMVPEYPGLSALESSFLMHEESSKIAWDIAERAQAQGYNIVWDITMSSTGSVEKRIAQLQDEIGPEYEMQGLFVDVAPETSVMRAMGRHKRGMDNNPNGGRLVPPFVTLEAVDDVYSSTNRRAFEQMKDHFSRWTLTTTEGVSEGEPIPVLGAGEGEEWKKKMRSRGIRKMSSIREDIIAYSEGDMDFQSLTQRISGANFKKPSRFEVGSFGYAREGYSYSEEGTWDEVNKAHNQGLLSREEYLTILNAAISQRSAKPKSPSLAQFAQGGGSGGGLSGERPENPMQSGGSEPKEQEKE